MTTVTPKKVLGHANGVKVTAKNTFSVPLQKRQFRELCDALSTAIAGLGNHRPTETDGGQLRRAYEQTYGVLARLCSAEGKTREFDPKFMHRLRFEQFDLINGQLCVSFLYSADGIPNAEYHFHLHDELAPYVDNYVDKYERAGGDKKLRRSYDLV